MDAKDFELFLHLGETLHFTNTSEAYALSPSSLSRIVRRWEAETGATLFDRGKGAVALTPAGELLQAYARQSLQQWQSLKGQLQSPLGQLNGRISLFCSVTASYYFLHDLLARFRRQYSAVEIQLHTGDTAETVQRIIEGKEDVGIAALPRKYPAKLRFKLIGESPLVFIAPLTPCPLRERLDHLLMHGAELPWGDIPLILSESGLTRAHVNDWLKDGVIQPRVYAQVSGHEAIVSMVSLGFGVGVVPRLVVDQSPLSATVQILDQAPTLEPIRIGLCALARSLTRPVVRSFWDSADAAD